MKITNAQLQQQQSEREARAMSDVDRITAVTVLNIRTTCAPHERWLSDDRADQCLLMHTQKAMRHRLHKARNAGRTSWWDKTRVTDQQLQELLYQALDDGDLISVSNYAAMLHIRKLTDNYQHQ